MGPKVGAPAAARQDPSAARPPPPSAARSTPAIKPPSEDVIDVPAEDMDLAALAELAKRVVDRKP
jgi:hypothetical protein